MFQRMEFHSVVVSRMLSIRQGGEVRVWVNIILCETVICKRIWSGGRRTSIRYEHMICSSNTNTSLSFYTPCTTHKNTTQIHKVLTFKSVLLNLPIFLSFFFNLPLTNPFLPLPQSTVVKPKRLGICNSFSSL